MHKLSYLYKLNHWFRAGRHLGVGGPVATVSATTGRRTSRGVGVVRDVVYIVHVVFEGQPQHSSASLSIWAGPSSKLDVNTGYKHCLLRLLTLKFGIIIRRHCYLLLLCM